MCHRSAAAAPGLLRCRLATPVDRLPILELVAPLPDGAAFMDAVVATERCAVLQAQQQRLLQDTQAARPGPAPLPPLPPLVTVVAEVGGAMVGAFVISTGGSSALAWQAATHSFDLDSLVAPHLHLPPQVR